jgi:hypothetical protein
MAALELRPAALNEPEMRTVLAVRDAAVMAPDEVMPNVVMTPDVVRPDDPATSAVAVKLATVNVVLDKPALVIGPVVVIPPAPTDSRFTALSEDAVTAADELKPAAVIAPFTRTNAVDKSAAVTDALLDKPAEVMTPDALTLPAPTLAALTAAEVVMDTADTAPADSTLAAVTAAVVLRPPDPTTAPTALTVLVAVSDAIERAPLVDRPLAVIGPAEVRLPATTANADTDVLDVNVATDRVGVVILAAATGPVAVRPVVPTMAAVALSDVLAVIDAAVIVPATDACAAVTPALVLRLLAVIAVAVSRPVDKEPDASRPVI